MPHKSPYPDGLATWRQLSGGAGCYILPRKGSAGQHAGQHCGRALRRQHRLPVSPSSQGRSCRAQDGALTFMALEGLCRSKEH